GRRPEPVGASPLPAAAPEPVPATPEPVPATPEPEEEPAFRFRPKVCSSYMREIFGDTMVETWFSLVDAVMAGEDSFACPDAETYYWVMGQFPELCFPVLDGMLDYAGRLDEPVVDGVARFEYRISREEAAARIAAFAGQVEEILNETLEPDDSDFEKALALYEYCTKNWLYEPEDPGGESPETADGPRGSRVFTEGRGVCREISAAYSYLLLQAGADASVVYGERSGDGALHQWSCVRINGRHYHVDPTYGLGGGELDYFLMDDAQREAADGYRREDFVFCSSYAQEHPHPAYIADDASFQPLRGGRCGGFDRESRTLLCVVTDENGREETLVFDYGGWEDAA
nr:transglutaminase-like domain-containing protein [Oscillospiraceae bacterium]